MTDKSQEATNANTMNLLQNGQYSWNTFFSRRGIWVLPELIHRYTQNHITEQMYIWNPMTTGLIKM